MQPNDNIQPMQVLENPDPDYVYQHFVSKQIPVVLKGAALDWPAMKKWTGPSFVETYGERKLKVVRGEQIKYIPLAQYLNYIKTTTHAQPYYLRDWNFMVDSPELAADFHPAGYFNNWLARVPGKQINNADFNYIWIFIGAKNSGSKLHQDVFDTCAWNAVISGKKQWLFFPVEQTENVYSGEVDGFNPDLNSHPNFAKAKGFSCIQEAGDIVYTPGQWWHQVNNIEAGISVTENYINEANVEVIRNYINREKMVAQLRGQNPEFVLGNSGIENTLQQFIPELFESNQGEAAHV